MSNEPDIIEHDNGIHRYTSHMLHRECLLECDSCGCFFCLTIFAPSEITNWTDNNMTAICPYCGIDSVIGALPGFTIEAADLQIMHDKSFWKD